MKQAPTGKPDGEDTLGALMAAFAAGDARAASALAHGLAPIVYRLAARLLGDGAEAEDVTQEAMMRLWKIAPRWRQGEARVTTWLYRVTANLATDRLRRRRTVGLDLISEPADPEPGAEARLIAAGRSEALRVALDDLPERQRTAVVLRHLEGLGNPEIAEIMEVSVEAVESLTARGKRRLASLLAGRRAELGLDA